ncbi:MAG: phosphoribosylaminoimidazolesuccinocarboxamide synthase, partial [Methanobacteriota archaeon]
MELVRKGKVKESYAVSDAELEFFFTDSISVFDKIIPTEVPKKGEVLCRVSAHWFKLVERAGVRSHFLSQ